MGGLVAVVLHSPDPVNIAQSEQQLPLSVLLWVNEAGRAEEEESRIYV